MDDATQRSQYKLSVNGDCMLPRISISSSQSFCCRQISEALTGQALEFVSWGQGVSRHITNCHGRSECEWSRYGGPIIDGRVAALAGFIDLVSMILISEFWTKRQTRTFTAKSLALSLCLARGGDFSGWFKFASHITTRG